MNNIQQYSVEEAIDSLIGSRIVSIKRAEANSWRRGKEDTGSDVNLVATEALWNYWSSLQQILTKSLRGNLLCE